MSTRPIVPLILAALLGLLQVQIWTGRGSVRQVAEQQQRLAELRASNQQAEADIARLRSEISDLREGLHTVEEKARYELGMSSPTKFLCRSRTDSARAPTPLFMDRFRRYLVGSIQPCAPLRMQIDEERVRSF